MYVLGKPSHLPFGKKLFINVFIGVKRNDERYMFAEPWPPVDAVRPGPNPGYPFVNPEH